MCFHGNQLSWAIKHPVISLYLKYHSPGFICFLTTLAPVISSLDEIYCNKFPAHLTGESFVGTLLGAYERGDPVGESVDDDAEEHGENVAQRVAPHELVRRGLSPDGVQEKRRQSERNGAENQHDHSTHQHQNLTRNAVGPGMGGRERCTQFNSLF